MSLSRSKRHQTLPYEGGRTLSGKCKVHGEWNEIEKDGALIRELRVGTVRVAHLKQDANGEWIGYIGRKRFNKLPSKDPVGLENSITWRLRGQGGS